MTAPPPALDVHNVTVTYANGVTAVRNASFKLRSSTICALVGINGSGKSTLFKTLMGFLQPSTGHVTICGKPVKEALRNGLMAYVPQSEDVDWTFPILVEDVAMMGRYGHMGFLKSLSQQGCLIFVSTHNLGSVPEFCDEVVLFNQTVLAYGPTSKTFTEENLIRAFGGVLRHVRLGGKDLHEDDDKRRVTVLTDDERPLVLYGERHGEKVMPADKDKGS